MTTPEGDDEAGAAPSAAGAGDRPRRAAPARSGPIRSGMAAAGASAGNSDADADGAPSPGSPPPGSDDLPISEAIAASVKTGYDVISENIAQARAAAEKFRDGKYNIRQVPRDLESMGLNMLKLARELSATTFDVCEQLLHQLTVAGAPPPGQAPVPPFREVQPTPPAPASSPAADQLKLTVRFSGAQNAIARTGSLRRPTEPTSPDQITTSGLAARTGGAQITEVGFQADLAQGGLIATATIPPGLPPGVYAGMVYAAGQDVPLGVLAVEIQP